MSMIKELEKARQLVEQWSKGKDIVYVSNATKSELPRPSVENRGPLWGMEISFLGDEILTNSVDQKLQKMWDKLILDCNEDSIIPPKLFFAPFWITPDFQYHVVFYTWWPKTWWPKESE
jgi:hypothetical protein